MVLTDGVDWPKRADWAALWSVVGPQAVQLAATLSERWGLPIVLPAQVQAGAAALWEHPAVGVLRLHDSLAGPAPLPGCLAQWVDADAAPLALDRWRHTLVACVMAGAVDALERAWGPPTDLLERAWRQGLAADAVDALEPALGLAAYFTAALRLWPLDGALAFPGSLLLWARFSGIGWQADPQLTDDGWARLGVYLRDHTRGPALPWPVTPAAALPWSPRVVMAPLSFRPVTRQGRALGAWSVTGAAPRTLEPTDTAGVVVFGSVRGGELSATDVARGPLGSFRLDSGRVGTYFGAARGVTLTLGRGGRASLTAADAWVGPVDARVLEQAQKMGVSGSADGTWRLTRLDADGRSGALRVAGLSKGMATVHGRNGAKFAFPAEEWLGPVRHFLLALEGQALEWTCQDERKLVVKTPAFGGGLELRFTRES